GLFRSRASKEATARLDRLEPLKGLFASADINVDGRDFLVDALDARGQTKGRKADVVLADPHCNHPLRVRSTAKAHGIDRIGIGQIRGRQLLVQTHRGLGGQRPANLPGEYTVDVEALVLDCAALTVEM